MSATQTVTTTTTTRKWEGKKKPSVANAYKAEVNRAEVRPKKKKTKRCPTCGRPL